MDFNLRILCDELSILKHKYYQIGVQLGISYDKLKEFAKEDDPLAASVDYWLKGNAKEGIPCCWQSIVDVLKSSHVDEHGIAEKIDKKYCIRLEKGVSWWY